MTFDHGMGSRCKLPCIVFLVIFNSACVSFPQRSDYVDCDLNAFSITTEAVISQPRFIADEICITDEFINRKYADVLVISGGASDGAFGAGFISELVNKKKMAVLNSDYPSPCIITGVSTGAIMSPFVYLATSLDAEFSSTYTSLLEELYPKLDDENLLFPKAGALRLLRLPNNKSLYASNAIRAELNNQLTDKLIEDLVKEHKATKRKIYIVLTNVYTGNYEIVDLTRLLAKYTVDQKVKQKQCITEVIRGSTAIPVVFEPVPIKDNQAYKLYVDGGLRYPFFLHKQMIEALRKVGNQLGKPEKIVRAYVVINHLGHAKTFNQNESEFSSLGIKEYIGNNAEITRNQLYLNASNTLYETAKNENVCSFWVDAQSGKPCEKPDEKYFHGEYQQCLVNYGVNQANDVNPWSPEPNLMPALLN